MPKYVQVPGYDAPVEFPDDMSEDAIAQAIGDMLRPRGEVKLPLGVPGVEVDPEQASRFLRGAAGEAGRIGLRLAKGVSSVLPDSWGRSLGMYGGADAAITRALEAIPEPEGVAGQAGALAAQIAPTVAMPVLGVAGEAALGAVQAQATGGNPVTGAAMGAAFRGATRAPQAARFLRDSAKKQFAQAVHPTTLHTKAIVRLQGERMLQEPGFFGKGLESMLEHAKAQVATATQKVQAAWRMGGSNIVDMGPITQALARLKQKRVWNGVAFSPVVKHVEELERKLFKATHEFVPPLQKGGKGWWREVPATADGLRIVRDGLDDIVTKAGGYTSHLTDLNDATNAWVAREARRIIAKQVAKVVPNLDEVNKAFSYWERSAEALQATVGRKTGQQEAFKHVRRIGYGALLSLLTGAAIGGKAALVGAGVILSDLMTTSQWRTASSALKMRLAKAIEHDDVRAAQRIIGRLVAAGGAQATAGAQ